MMKYRYRSQIFHRVLLAAIFFLFCNPLFAKEISWKQYNKESFELAAKEGKYILMDLEAVWCHWCHVMDKVTYKDKNVQRLIAKNYVAVKVDHDARPDLAERYREWGWPATIIFAPDGREIVKRSGYMNPENMTKLLLTVINDPSSEGLQISYPEIISPTPLLTKDLKRTLSQRHISTHDDELGGLKTAQKFIDRDSVDWDIYLATQGDAEAMDRAIRTLDSGLNLIDAEFGGAYQYSTNYDWEHPHYEKIMKTQHGYLRIYARAYKQFNKTEYKEAAEKIAYYLMTMLNAPEGAFYTSQDADLTQGAKSHDYFSLAKVERMRLGLPKIDKHTYAAETAMATEALLVLYDATKDVTYLKRAKIAISWILKNRRLGKGGYRHNQVDVAGPHLSDSLFTGRALFQYYLVTGDKSVLKAAFDTVDFIGRHFKHPIAGLVSSSDNGTPVKPVPQIDQNISAARWLSELEKYAADDKVTNLKNHIQRYLVTPEISLSRLTEAGVLLADAGVF